jgi:hypothetical protein
MSFNYSALFTYSDIALYLNFQEFCVPGVYIIGTHMLEKIKTQVILHFYLKHSIRLQCKNLKIINSE